MIYSTMKHINLFENFGYEENPIEITIRMTDQYKSYLKQNGLIPTDNSWTYANPDKIELYDNSGLFGNSSITKEFNLVCIYTSPDSSEYNRDTAIRSWVAYDRVNHKLQYYTSFFDYRIDKELNKQNLSSFSPFFKNQYEKIDREAQSYNQKITDSSKAKRDKTNFFISNSYGEFKDGVVVGAFDHGNYFEIVATEFDKK